jgi:hypothetical protein
MKFILAGLVLMISLATFQTGYGQGSSYTNMSQIPGACGVYGDANGNSNWDWTLTADKNDPAYNGTWSANTGNAAGLTFMGDPFYNATNDELSTIYTAQDYTPAKGWELLRRDFGCSHTTAYPYFVLYNRYSGLMRIYVYAAQQLPYTQFLLDVTPEDGDPYPSYTAMANDIMGSPDRFLANTSGSDTVGSEVVSLMQASQNGGLYRWSVLQFSPVFDQHIADALYQGRGLQFQIYGVTSSSVSGSISGTAVQIGAKKTSATGSGSTPNTFTATGAKFTAFSKDLSSAETLTTNLAKGIQSQALTDAAGDTTSQAYQIYKDATSALSKTGDLTQVLGDVAEIGSLVSGVGTALNLLGSVEGLFSKSSSTSKTPASAPLNASINLALNATITTSVALETFVIKDPGAQLQVIGGSVSNSDAPYYQCPLGIFNLTSTPQADTVVYKMNTGVQGTNTVLYTGVQISNNVGVTWNDGAGLNLVSVQAAIMGKVLPNSTGTASYNPYLPEMSPNGNSPLLNILAPDFEAGRLISSVYDASPAKLHLFQTPYVNLQCLQGLSVNVPLTTNVYLRIKAVLTSKNDPTNTPIYYIQDYQLQKNRGTMALSLREGLQSSQGYLILPPFANYNTPPTWWQDALLFQSTITPGTPMVADNSITNSGTLTAPTNGQSLVFEAGRVIYLQPGFSAPSGSNFSASISNFGFTTTCGTLNSTPFDATQPCYNGTVTPLAKKPTTATGTAAVVPNSLDSAVSIYPIPAQQSLTITGLDALGKASIAIFDQSGRQLLTVSKEDTSPTMLLNVSGLSNGVYFIEIQGETQKLTRKIIIAR